MWIIPSIYIQDGKCVHVSYGDKTSSSPFEIDPLDLAKKWADLGADRLHIVQLGLNASTQNATSLSKNNEVLSKLIEEVSHYLPLQIAGGIKTMASIESYLDMGFDFVVVGSAGVKDPHFMNDACSAFNGQVILGLDARDGKVVTDSWSKVTKFDAVTIAQRLTDEGIDSIIYTDMGPDGNMTEVNLEATLNFAKAVDVPVLACGDVGQLSRFHEIKTLVDHGVDGIILGKSLDLGVYSLQEAIDIVDSLDD
ncbi:HisA/HisF-related TIM barrel protein [Taylorella equigenitalis]|uniref:1-(5-phosphoribosyl)-5-[(5-phosphoribosylamino)methylideneamino] imidazole-4-carboxamide isomerase n=4 Tax=Taylorella equigenitalis TaxID=29575 RepID=A0A654KGB2_TAYEM|nr:HisA/HisF-related TIM barrel protein [Taylorella equigenitalis]ADU91429.1 Phosphoribosylformimino-5-aminoimidazole carboxamide ribotide isomerase [Taylorella equigenitalis MCE9]ACF32332.1 HisA [Taylorella equigenitalis ATCC 35865]AFN36515.1 1-(5-phosphoribosyl)-5-[(5-phosphoribosylamino) methylideneamino] imidazole-4-carboxamide isomerase [Taylorella equigenitalis ATCC 35865]ASY31082.1 phosphoribosylformimino-5-aminoimidazole carboxamide ribotide isomerase [Taylorella equigenitalis]ASY38384